MTIPEARPVKALCARCGVTEDGTYWPTCADLTYKNPDRNWVPLHSLACRPWENDDLDICDNCELEIQAPARKDAS